MNVYRMLVEQCNVPYEDMCRYRKVVKALQNKESISELMTRDMYVLINVIHDEYYGHIRPNTSLLATSKLLQQIGCYEFRLEIVNHGEAMLMIKDVTIRDNVI